MRGLEGEVSGFVYFASPYTPVNGESVASRVTAACKCAAQLMREGLAVFSPIVHSHYIADHLDESIRMDHEFWMHQDLGILAHAERMIVLRLPGWQVSRGIRREMDEANRLGIPIDFLEP